MASHQQNSILSRLRLFVYDRTGVAAVEFAYLAPLLILMMFGTFEIARGLIVHKRFQRATAMVADLVTREQKFGETSTETKTALDGVMRSIEYVMWPYSSEPLKVGITQVLAAFDDPTETTVEWRYSYNEKGVLACGTPKSLDVTLVGGNRAVVVESEYKYKPVLAELFPWLLEEIDWGGTMVLAPRKGNVEGVLCAD